LGRCNRENTWEAPCPGKGGLSRDILSRHRPAQAGDPVLRGGCNRTEKAAAYWIPRWSLSSGSPQARPDGGGITVGVQIRTSSIQTKHTSAFLAARIAPELCANLPQNRGRGELPGRSMHPQPRVRNEKAHEHSHHRFTGFTRHSRTQWFFNGLFRALPGDEFVLSPSSADFSVLPDPVGADNASANLTPATGARTTRLHRPPTTSFVSRAVNRSQAQSPPLRCLSRPTLPRPPHPMPNVRDDRETPLFSGTGWVNCKIDLGRKRKRKYF